MRLLLAILVLFLSACQQGPVRDINSPYYRIPVGSVLVLKRPLELPPDAVSLYIQDSELMDPSLLNRYQPYCKFEMWSRIDKRRVVEPDEFVVARTAWEWEYVKGLSLPVQVAAFGVGIFDDDGPMAIIDKTLLYLQSDRQPDVYRITCEHWSRPIDSRPLKVAEIRATLKALFDLNIKGQP